MNFDAVEGLSEKEISALYTDIIENSNNEFITGIRCDNSGNNTVSIWEIRCNNGRMGYFLWRGVNHGIGWKGQANGYHYGSAAICGWGQSGYETVVGLLDESASNAALWHTTCSKSGRSCYCITDYINYGVGWSYSHASGYNPNTAGTVCCGSGDYAYERVVSHMHPNRGYEGVLQR